jgi:hypothetical protein
MTAVVATDPPPCPARAERDEMIDSNNDLKLIRKWTVAAQRSFLVELEEGR